MRGIVNAAKVRKEVEAAVESRSLAHELSASHFEELAMQAMGPGTTVQQAIDAGGTP